MFVLVLSALCYTLAFWHPTLWPLIFLFPVLLPTSRISFPIACIWGFFVSCGHIIPIAAAFFSMSHGHVLVRILPGSLLIAYIALVLSLWLWLLSTTHNRIFWTLGLWAFFIYVDRMLLLPFGMWDGNPFMNPLMILPPTLLTLAPIIGIPALLLLFACTTSTIRLWIQRHTAYSFVCMIFLLIPWLASPLLIRQKNTPIWLSTVGYLPIMIPKNSSCSIISHTIHSNPHLSTIILPESACAQLPKIHPSINIITGSFVNKNDMRLNVICWITKNNTLLFEKTHTLPLAEQLPYWLNWTWLNSCLFSQECPATLASTNSRPLWHLAPDLTVVPYICSELFFASGPRDSHSSPILTICNDWWFDMPHFKKLMALAARLRAIVWHRPILYVSYTYGLFFDEFGNSSPIKRL